MAHRRIDRTARRRLVVSFAAALFAASLHAVPTSASPTAPAAPVAARSRAAPARVAAAGDIGWEGPSFEGSSGSPSGSKPESKLWFNDGRWWADLWDSATGSFAIHRLDLAGQRWVPTATRLDDRANSRSDALWDGSHLFVASHAFAEGSGTTASAPAELRRFSYQSATDTYVLDPGFPVTVNNARSESLVIERDSLGRIWATWMEDRKIMVSVSAVGGTSFATPTVLPVTGAAVSSDDLSSIVAFAGNRIGVLWSNQDDEKMYFSSRLDTSPVGTWGATETAYQGTSSADDHINLKNVADQNGRILAAVKTSQSGSAPLVHLLDRNPTTGAWTSHLFGRGSDNHTRPIVVVDRTHQAAHMFATSGQSGGSIYEKTAPLSNLTFPTGKGTAVLTDASDPDINNATSTKQPVDATTGLVVLATNDSTRQYWTHYDALSGTPPPTPPVAAFTATPTSGSAPLQVTFTNASTGATSYAWGFGDGGTSSLVSPVHTYTAPGSYTVTLTATGVTGSNAATRLIQVTPAAVTGAVYVAMAPCRVIDTRGAAGGSLAPGEQRDFQVSGNGASGQGGAVGGCGVPDGAVAVQASVTAVSPGADGFARAWPTGQPASGTVVNFTGGRSVTNTGAVALAPAGRLDLTLQSRSARAVDYAVDVLGYYVARASVSSSTGAVYVPMTPCRVVDTRAATAGALAAGEDRSFQVAGDGAAGQGGAPGGCHVPDGAVAAEASVSAVAPTAGGYARAWPTGAGPGGTILNFGPGRSATNTGALALATTGRLDLTVGNRSGSSVHYVVDVQGYYVARSSVPAGVGAVFVAMAPCRSLDTRAAAAGPLAADGRRNVRIAGPGAPGQGGTAAGCGVPEAAVAVEASITAVSPGATGYLRAWPADTAAPNSTVLNFRRAESVTNTGALALAAGGGPDLSLWNRSGAPANLVLDVQGYFVRP